MGGQGRIGGAKLQGLPSDLPRHRDIPLLVRDIPLKECEASCNHSENEQYRQDGGGTPSSVAIPTDAGVQEGPRCRAEFDTIGNQVAGLAMSTGIS